MILWIYCSVIVRFVFVGIFNYSFKKVLMIDTGMWMAVNIIIPLVSGIIVFQKYDFAHRILLRVKHPIVDVFFSRYNSNYNSELELYFRPY
jgi:hypothetical protein